MKKLNWAFSIAIALSGVLAHAESDRPLGIQDDSVKLVELPNQPSRLVFGDGREATLMVSKDTIAQVNVPFKITENNCAPSARAPRCTYTMNLARSFANYLWTKNPDASRLGQPLIVSYGGDQNQPVNPQDIITTNYTKFASPNTPNSLTADTITCDQMDWLPQGQQREQNVTMKLWSGEVMTANSESDMNENQAFFTYGDLTWQRQGNKLTLKNIKQLNTIVLFPALTDTSMIIMDDRGQECQISSAGSLKALNGVGSSPSTELVDIAPPSLRIRQTPNLKFSLDYPLNQVNGGKYIK
ncbi:hypothetical protein DOM22_11160 [Bdellovibrio sp. ZAP7]|uniref:hypothetical protein n=1 Tax=Bdellovibrio sp. ZAP7 TaxID=2231053 RepID=UPI00115A8655|nr:hypothetical protein [Bdellovibrio sp. ZAP7]QDK45665.1 hypothetical protein DOM22_11160 [Bdellovibrio sp. ZAP7]